MNNKMADDYMDSLIKEIQSLQADLNTSKSRGLELERENERLRGQNKRLYKALDIALHDLVTGNNLLVTDRPDLINLNMVVYKTNNRQYTFGDYSWMSDYTDSIKMAEEALSGEDALNVGTKLGTDLELKGGAD